MARPWRSWTGRSSPLAPTSEIDAYIGSDTEVIDLAGQLAIPGFIDSHVHFSGIGTAQLQLKLMEVANWDEVVEMVAAAVAEAEPGELITGRGWHQEKWDRTPEPNVDGLPFHQTLDAVSPDNPVLLTHASGHATYANGQGHGDGRDRRGTHRTPRAGRSCGTLTGIPSASSGSTRAGSSRRARANAAEPDPREVMELADREVLSKGITSVHDAGVGLRDHRPLQGDDRRGRPRACG